MGAGERPLVLVVGLRIDDKLNPHLVQNRTIATLMDCYLPSPLLQPCSLDLNFTRSFSPITPVSLFIRIVSLLDMEASKSKRVEMYHLKYVPF